MFLLVCRLNALWFASHIQAEPLTPALNLLPLEHYNPYQMKLLALTLRALKDEIPRLEAFLDDSDEHGDESLREKYIGEDLPHAFYTPLDGEKTFLQE